jgi:hypothetical protein
VSHGVRTVLVDAGFKVGVIVFVDSVVIRSVVGNYQHLRLLPHCSGECLRLQGREGKRKEGKEGERVRERERDREREREREREKQIGGGRKGRKERGREERNEMGSRVCFVICNEKNKEERMRIQQARNIERRER